MTRTKLGQSGENGRNSTGARSMQVFTIEHDGRLAQRLERPAYTGKVRGSIP